MKTEFPRGAVGSPGHACVGPITYRGHDSIRRNIRDLQAALSATPAVEGFLTAVAPASTGYDAENEYYKDEREYVFAIAEALREEYLEIHKAGLVLQVDDAVLANMYDELTQVSPERYQQWAQLRIEALNHALRGIPEDRVRYHICFGSWHVPHVADAPLEVIVPLMLQVHAGAYSIEAANVRHEHEWRVWQDVTLPAGKILIPGVVTHHTTTVEHPRLVADRIVRLRQAGRARERHRRHRLRLRAGGRAAARASAGDVGEARGAGRRRADRVAGALELRTGLRVKVRPLRRYNPHAIISCTVEPHLAGPFVFRGPCSPRRQPIWRVLLFMSGRERGRSAGGRILGRTSMRRSTAFVIAFLASLVAVSAHHGVGTFELNKTVSFPIAKLTKVELHQSALVAVLRDDRTGGKVQKHRCEMRSAHTLRRSGWSTDIFPRGAAGSTSPRRPTGPMWPPATCRRSSSPTASAWTATVST